jgi:sn-glycerol 3-phosphate transport system ATP-binding protein
MAELVLEDVVKVFGNTEVLHGITTRIRDGEFVVIVGPSGCGKSTLLRLIAGLEHLTRGRIAIDGRIVNDLEPKDRDIAMVFQNYALYPHMSVFDNMAYGLKLRRMPKADIRQRVHQAAALLQLKGLLDRKPRELSGGQRQRVAMGRCIVRNPKVFLFDEPLSNLDARLRVQMRLELRNLHERLQVTSVYVTHDQVEAMTLGDRLIVMDDGHAVQIGSPLEVYEKPASLFVAGFIGSPAMNVLEGRIGEDGGSVVLSSGERLPLLPTNGHLPAWFGRSVMVGIRPEHIRRAGDRNALINLRIGSVEVLGADTLLYGRLGNGSGQLTVRVTDNDPVPKGTDLPVTFAPEHLMLFDPHTGRRLDGGDWMLKAPRFR